MKQIPDLSANASQLAQVKAAQETQVRLLALNIAKDLAHGAGKSADEVLDDARKFAAFMLNDEK
jgi:hypothetical protein